MPAPFSPSLTRARRKEETRARVLRTALELFVKNGYGATSTADIARHAEVAHGTVFNIAPTKERLALEACQDRLRETGAAALAAGRRRKGLRAQCLTIFEALYDFYAAHPELSRVLLKEQVFAAAPEGEARQEELMQDFFAGFGLLAAEAQARGELRKEVKIPDLITGVFSLYLLFLLALLNGRYATRAEHRKAYEGALKVLLEGNATALTGR
ncbi:MAG TPA: TetR/AcrR family transcriptional regulator [Verrucomicrobiales bacterium]|jgi:AcrR family transcriptional regulator|nr:TetR/AcrR family transcriptional regulator [Verrucomicrobiales bacterium]